MRTGTLKVTSLASLSRPWSVLSTSLALRRPSLPMSIGEVPLIVSRTDWSAWPGSAGMIVSVRPSPSVVPRSASGTAERCSTTRVGLSAFVLFQAIHTPTADTISAAGAISSPRLIQRRRRVCDSVSFIGCQLPIAGAAPQASNRPASKLVRGAHQLGQARRCTGPPASLEPLADLVPVDVAAIELHAQPAARAIIFGPIIDVGLRLDQPGHLVGSAGLDQQADRFLSVMVIGDDREQLAFLTTYRPAGRSMTGLAADLRELPRQRIDLGFDPLRVKWARRI